MGILQQTLDAQLSKLPHAAFKKLIAEHLLELGLTDDTLADSIARSILEDRPVDIPEGHPAQKIVIDEQKTLRLDEIIAEQAKALESAIPSLIDHVAKIEAENFQKCWDPYQTNAENEFSGFRKRLIERWSKPLSVLRLLNQISRDIGAEISQKHSISRLKRNKPRNEAMIRLHLNFCQVASEIICLLENGFSEGALARWRTLLELMVYTAVIREGGDTLAQRFLDYEAVERKKTLDEEIRCAELTGAAPPPPAEQRAIIKRYNSVRAKYNPEFKESYGWAGGQLGLPLKVKFDALQKLAGSSHQRIDYKFASFGVHATPQSPSTLQWFTPKRIAGATNGGLEIPGELALHTLTRMAILMIEQPWDMDNLVLAQSIVILRDKGIVLFREAAQKLRRDEASELAKATRKARLHNSHTGWRRPSTKGTRRG